MVKRVTAGICVLVILICLASCGASEENYALMLNETDISEGTLTAERDTHGGFHGDGLFYSSFLFEGESRERFGRELSVNESWHALPLSETLSIAAYGGMYNDVSYGILLAFSDGDECNLPEVQNGYWYFVDRHPKAVDMESSDELLSRYSYNFVFAIYDCDTGILSYYRLDT